MRYLRSVYTDGLQRAQRNFSRPYCQYLLFGTQFYFFRKTNVTGSEKRDNFVTMLWLLQALPDSSDEVSWSCLFNLPTTKKSWQIKLHNRSTSLKLQNTISIPEVIFQSMFSRTFTSFSKKKGANANCHNSATRYFRDETSGAFYS